MRYYLAFIMAIWLACNIASDETPPVAASATSGSELYIRYCSACHGTDGPARINGATNLRQSSLDSVRLLKIVREGRNKMPSFKTQLSIEETSEIVSYILTLSKEE